MRFRPACLLLAATLSSAAFAADAKKDQPLTPGGKWRPHDMARPRPPVVTPAPAGAPVPAPADAEILFDGKDLSKWTRDARGNDPDKSKTPSWKIENGCAEVVPGRGGISTRDKFGDVQLHIEWATPSEVKGNSQGRGNSGVLLHGIGEVQILDSYDNDTYPDGQAGAIYGKYPPLVNASRKPGEWQTYDIIVQLAKLDDKGKRIAPMKLTVFHNGVLVQHAAELDSTAREWSFGLQDHLNPMRFRNIWVRKLNFDTDAAGTPPPPAPPKPAPAPKKSAAIRKNEQRIAKVDSTSAASATLSAANEATVALAPHPFVQPALGGFDSGELLLATLNCSSCHSASGIAPARFPAKKSPTIGKDGLRLSPQFLRDYLANPQREKPGTTMPDALHALPAAEKAAAVDALVHFLVSESPAESAPQSPNETLIAKGRALFHDIGCVACHAPQEPADAAAKLAASSVPHGDLAKKHSVGGLSEFLSNPGKFRAARRMPFLNLKKDESLALAMYLLREQATDAPTSGTKITKGLRYEFFKGDFKDCGPSLEKATPTSTGSMNEIDVSQWIKTGESFAVRFSGQFEVPADATYTFSTTSDDGTRLWIDGKEVVENDGKHPKIEKSGSIPLKAGTHALVLTYFQAGKSGWFLAASFGAPGLKTKPLKGAMFTHVGGVMRPLGETDFKVDAAKAARGRQLYGELGCAQCHHTTGVKDIPSPKFAAKKLLDLKPDTTGSCLAPQPAKGAPLFHLSDAQRDALKRTLAASKKLKPPLAPAQEVTRVMNFLNCYACHSRDGIGGPTGARGEFFHAAIEVDLGDEGRLPPHLTKVGAKLRTDWLNDVLTKKGAVRPYMATRMPQFGAPVEKLAEAFTAADSPGPIPATPDYDNETAKVGRWLVGTMGYSCIQCHSFGKHASLGVPAIDLTTMTKRLRPDWFARYLPDPAALRPGTRMPSFFPDGKAANTHDFGGDTAKQIASIWMFLSKGAQADAPPGLIRAAIELIADKEPIIYRNFIEGAGSRAIGVGYPEKANLAFDANELRLALLWHGPFIDAGRHRTGRGAGYEAPMGYDLLKLPSGPPFAVLASESEVWPDKTGHAAGYQFHGYNFDDQRRPTLRYEFRGAQVEDFFTPTTSPERKDATFKRTLTFMAEQPVANLYFRAASAAKIVSKDGVFIVEEKMRLIFPGAKPLLRRVGDKTELLVPVTFNAGQAQIVEEILW